MATKLPLTGQWLATLDSMLFIDPFKGSLLGELSERISHPFWCRQGFVICPAELHAELHAVVPLVRTKRLGGKHLSEKLETHKYYTNAWSMYPCTCQYRYSGWMNQAAGTIKNPNPALSPQETSANLPKS